MPCGRRRPAGRGSCTDAAEIERELPFGLLRQLLERPLEALSRAERARLLDGPASPASALLSGLDLEVPYSSAAIAHGCCWALARLAERTPLCLLVDDLQWADGPSLTALGYLSRRVAEHPILIVAAVRDGASAPEQRSLSALIDEASAVLRPAPLSESACGLLGGAVLGRAPTPAFRRACATATGGNPWLLQQLLAACREGGLSPDGAGAARVSTLVPRAVGRTVLRRLAGSDGDAVALAQSLAILERARIADAARLAGLDLAAATTSAEALAAAGILDRGLPLRFAHPLARAAVAAELSEAERSRRHREAAAILAPVDPATAAAHLLRSEPGSDRWAVDVLMRAAADARRRGSPATSVTLLERAVEEGGAAVVGERLGRARLAAGDPRASEELLAALAGASSAAERLRLAAVAAQAQFVAGDLPAALSTVRAALADPRARDDPRAHGELLAVYATIGFDDVRARSEIVRRVEVDGERAPQLRAVAAMDGLLAGRPAAEVVRWATQALDGLSARAGIEIASTCHLALFALAGCDAVAAADAAVERALLAARDNGSRFGLGLACFFRAWVRLRGGDLPGALADVEQTLAFAEHGGGFTVPNTRWVEAECALLQGRIDDGAAAPEIGIAAAREIGWGMTGAWLLSGRAAVALHRGEHEQALADALEAGAIFTELGAPSPAMADWRGRAVAAAVALGEDDRAAALAAEALELAEVVGTATVRAAACRAHARTLGIEERPARLQEAAAIAATGPNPVLHAEILLELGRAHRLLQQRVAAREPLLRAAELARRSGAGGLAEAARSELDATGARRRPEPSWGLESLTVRERELARMAGAGLSNPEIAARLFIRRKTVESHLSTVFRKLDLRSRDQLAAALRGDPPD